MTEVTIAELCKWWNPTNHRPADTTRFGPLMTQAWHQEQAREKAREQAAKTPAKPRDPGLDIPEPAPVRRPGRRKKVPPQDLAQDAGATV